MTYKLQQSAAYSVEVRCSSCQDAYRFGPIFEYLFVVKVINIQQ